MIRNMKTSYNCAGVLGTRYPEQPPYDPNCDINVDYETLPNSWPRMATVMGPRSMHQIYTGVPQYYPPQWFSRPIGTMYDHDLSSFGPYNKRETYGFKAYPYHHHSPREIRVYGKILPTLKLQEETVYTTQMDGYYGR